MKSKNERKQPERKNKNKEDQSKEKKEQIKQTTRGNNLSCPPPRRRGGQDLKKNGVEKNIPVHGKHITKTPRLANRVRQRTEEKITKRK